MKAKKNGIEISAENAEKIISKGIKALSDEELSGVTGGAFYRFGDEVSKSDGDDDASEEEALAILKKVQQALSGE